MSNNVLLVTADSLRADYCGVHGGPDTTPYLSQLAADSAVFDTAIAPGPRTPSSIALTHTGERFRKYDADVNTDRLERLIDHIRRFETIPERLTNHGYSTGAVTANPWTTQFDEPFDEFVTIGGGYDRDNSTERTMVEKGLDYINQWRHGTDWFAQWPSFYDEVLQLTESLSEPWFLWIFLMDTHSPYIVPRQYRAESNAATMYYSALRYNVSVMRGQEITALSAHLDQSLKRAYRDAIRSVDAFIEQLHRDVPEDTAIVFHSDHGEAFGEHGSYGHQESLYEENLHVPLLVYDGHTQTRIRQPISTLQIPQITEQTALGRFEPGALTDKFVCARTGDGTAEAVRTPSHWLLQSDNRVFTKDVRKDSDYSAVDDVGHAAALMDFFDAVFAQTVEKSKIAAVVEEMRFDGIGPSV